MSDANKKVKEALKDRIESFFRSQAYGAVATLDQLGKDFQEPEVAKMIPKEVAEAFADAKEAEKIEVPKAKAERIKFAFRGLILETLEEMSGRNGVIVKVKAPDGPGMGWVYNLEHAATPEPEAVVKELPIDQIRIDPKLQQREDGVEEAAVDRYAAVADRLPPARVFRIKGDEGKAGYYLLTRGFHRLAAWKKAKFDKVPVEIVDGTRDDAILDAAGDNAEHGKPRTMKDVRKALTTLLSTSKWKNASTTWLSETVHIAWATCDKLVKSIRAELGQEKPERVQGKGGQVHASKKNKKGATEGAAPETPIPSGPAPAPESVPSGVKDRLGVDVPKEAAPAFLDTRYRDSLANMQQQINFLREFRTDGYAFSSIDLKNRETILAEIETKIETMVLSLPYAAVPSGAKVEAAIARRGWMTQAEHAAFVKADKPKGGKKKKTGETEAPAATTEAAPQSEEPKADTIPIPVAAGENAESVPQSAA